MDIGSNTEYYAFDFLDRGDCAIREDDWSKQRNEKGSSRKPRYCQKCEWNRI